MKTTKNNEDYVSAGLRMRKLEEEKLKKLGGGMTLLRPGSSSVYVYNILIKIYIYNV